MAKNETKTTEETPELVPLTDAPAPVAQDAAGGPSVAEIVDGLDDDALEALAAKFAQNPKTRRLFGVEERTAPTGRWDRNYEAERTNIGVSGGLEVQHGPEFEPLPPSYIKKWMKADGTGQTDAEDDALTGADGRPQKTPEYLHWMAARKQGGRIDSKVRNDMSAGQFVADDPGIDHPNATVAA